MLITLLVAVCMTFSLFYGVNVQWLGKDVTSVMFPLVFIFAAELANLFFVPVVIGVMYGALFFTAVVFYFKKLIV